LVARGAEPWRAIVQTVAVLICAIMFVLQVVRPGMAKSFVGLFIGTLTFFSAVGVTGGLSSPIFPSGLIMLFGAAVGMHKPRWLRNAFFGLFLACAVLMALLSRTALGQLTGPLAPTDGFASAEYVTIVLASIAFVAVGSFRNGCVIQSGYETVAFELA